MKRTSTFKAMIAGVMAATVLWVGQAAAQDIPLCVIYPTLCYPYSGPFPVDPLGLPGFPGVSPSYLANVLAPASPFVTQDTLAALPPLVHQALFPPQVAAAVNSGQVDAAINNTFNSIAPLLGAINGFGPGGAGYTNQAALSIWNGTSPIFQLGLSLSPQAQAICASLGGC